MISRICSTRSTFNFFCIVKPCLSSFTVRKSILNARSLCNVERGSVPESTSFVDNQSNSDKIMEQEYFKNIMNNNPKYPDLIFSEDLLKANEKSSNKLVTFFRSAVNSKISQKNEPDNYEVTDLTDFESDSYTLYDFIEIFHFLPIYCELYSKNLILEVEKLRKLMKNKVHVLKKSAEDMGLMITTLNLMKNAHIHYEIAFYLIIFIYNRYNHLTTTQLVEYFYILHYYKFRAVKETKYKFELNVTNKLPELNIDEIAVLSFGLFRCQIRPGSMLSEAISSEVLRHVENMNDLQACTIFKFLQYSGRRKISDNLNKIYEKCIPIIDKFTIITAVHIICAGISLNVECEELFKIVWDRANKEFDKMRLKDVERLVLASIYTNFRLTEDCNFVKLIREKYTKENEEIQRYSTSFFSLVKFLIVQNIYIEDMINYALLKEFHEALKEKYIKCNFHNVLFIECSVELERPEYNLNRLDYKTRKNVFMKQLSDAKKETSSNRCAYKILGALKEMYNEESVDLVCPLIHFPSIQPILCINRNNEPQAIGDKLRFEMLNTLKAPNDGNLWIIFVLLRYQGCLYNRKTPNLMSEAKLRHFRTAGYIPALAYNHELVQISDKLLEDYLTKAIEVSIQSINN